MAYANFQDPLMPRPCKYRRIGFVPAQRTFGPVAAGNGDGETVILTLDELESMRLVDFLGLYQEEAAARMGVSRQTLGNILADARRKTVGCLLAGASLAIGGGTVSPPETEFRCPACRHHWHGAPAELSPASECPACRQQGVPAQAAGTAGELPLPGRRHCCRRNPAPAHHDSDRER